MGRMLDALRMLEEREKEPLEIELDCPAPSLAVDWEQVLEGAQNLVELSLLEHFSEPLIKDVIRSHEAASEAESPPPLPVRMLLPTTPYEACVLPTVKEPPAYYHEMSVRIADQRATNYSNVLMFVTADRATEEAFSMTLLAQCFSQHVGGDVLLVDGDLRRGRLSKQIECTGPGMIDAMLGQAQWPDIIRPTNQAHIDFVSSGNGQVPTFERPQFGWSALRPRYRVVAIGLASATEPETNWLAARCDAVYYLLSRQHTRRAHASLAVNALRASGANVAGCIVVND